MAAKVEIEASRRARAWSAGVCHIAMSNAQTLSEPLTERLGKVA